MISGRASRIFISKPEATPPQGYTLVSDWKRLLGLKGSNIHIHISHDWEHDEGSFDVMVQVIVNLSCNPVPPTITLGQFDPRISRMLLAMELLTQQ